MAYRSGIARPLGRALPVGIRAAEADFIVREDFARPHHSSARRAKTGSLLQIDPMRVLAVHGHSAMTEVGSQYVPGKTLRAYPVAASLRAPGRGCVPSSPRCRRSARGAP